jgi:hypothetical protein
MSGKHLCHVTDELVECRPTRKLDLGHKSSSFEKIGFAEASHSVMRLRIKDAF